MDKIFECSRHNLRRLWDKTNLYIASAGRIHCVAGPVYATVQSRSLSAELQFDIKDFASATHMASISQYMESAYK